MPGHDDKDKKPSFVNQTLLEAIKIYGSQKKLATALAESTGAQVSQQNISSWLRNPNGVPTRKAKIIIELCPQLSLLGLLSPALREN